MSVDQSEDLICYTALKWSVECLQPYWSAHENWGKLKMCTQGSKLLADRKGLKVLDEWMTSPGWVPGVTHLTSVVHSILSLCHLSLLQQSWHFTVTETTLVSHCFTSRFRFGLNPEIKLKVAALRLCCSSFHAAHQTQCQITSSVAANSLF